VLELDVRCLLEDLHQLQGNRCFPVWKERSRSNY
jgi:hypothetical protein